MWIARDEPLVLRIVVIAICTLFTILSVFLLLGWYHSPSDWGYAFTATTALILSYGLAQMSAWARAFIVVLLWIPIFPLVVGVINPFHASDMMATGQTPPAVTTLLAFIIPPVTAILFCLHILGKYIERFH